MNDFKRVLYSGGSKRILLGWGKRKGLYLLLIKAKKEANWRVDQVQKTISEDSFLFLSIGRKRKRVKKAKRGDYAFSFNQTLE